jgi:hypothetical protein
METRYIVPLGDYIVLDTLVTLHFTIDIHHNMSNYHNPGVDMYIDLPSNYPSTVLGNSYKSDDQKKLFYAILTVSDRNCSTYDWFVNYVPEDYYSEDIEKVVILREFYIKAREYNIPLTTDEEKIIKGLGKRCLCLAMPYIIEYFSIDMDTTPIALTANGGIGLYNYYTKTYGFLPIVKSKTEISMFMVADLSVFMSRCK